MRLIDAVDRHRDAALKRPVHSTRTAAILGICLGLTFGVCFLTGLYSHVLQNPVGWFPVWTAPAGLYRVTQGVHVATGLASVPLLLAKLWTAFPRLFRWPPITGTAHALERLMLIPLVCGSVFLLFSGVANVSRWYPWGFYFPRAHYWVAWITIGAMIAHIGATASTARRALRSGAAPVVPLEQGTLGRRGFLGAVAAAMGLVTVTTIGQTFPPLRPATLFAQRRPDLGPQGLPVNKTAHGAGVVEAATDPAFRLRVTGDVEREVVLDAADLDARSGHVAELPIACVEGWSATATWRGVRVSDLLDDAGVDRSGPYEVEVESLQRGGRYRRSRLAAVEVAAADTMLAVAVNGERLDLDHGYPCRLIGPNRPGVMQTKWVTALVVRRG
jgi:DMSO/TMAO reductase YedYZ molybdopterin-dependent catalytic subunit